MSLQEFLSISVGLFAFFTFCQILFPFEELKRWGLFSFYWFSANCASSDHPKFCNWLPKLFSWTFSVANFFKSWCYNKQIWRTGNIPGWKPLGFLDSVSYCTTYPFGLIEPFQLFLIQTVFWEMTGSQGRTWTLELGSFNCATFLSFEDGSGFACLTYNIC